MLLSAILATKPHNIRCLNSKMGIFNMNRRVEGRGWGGEVNKNNFEQAKLEKNSSSYQYKMTD